MTTSSQTDDLRAKSGRWKGRLATAWPLFVHMTERAIRQRYKGSVLGVLWTLVNPLIMVGAYWIVFKFLFGSPIPNFALFMFVGMTGWALFFGGLTVGATSITGNATLVTKVNFPREIVPTSAIAANAVTALAMLIIAIPLCLAFPQGSWAPVLLVPVIIVLIFLMTLGLGLIAAGLNVYFRDIEHIITAPDGSVIVAGAFAGKLKRFGADGTPDLAFTANLGAAFNWSIWDIALQPDGKIVVVGDFTGLVRRVNADGTLDSGFNAAVGMTVDDGFGTSVAYTAAIQSNGTILVGGLLSYGLTIAEFNADGTPNPKVASTLLGALNQPIFALVIQPDAKIIAGGGYTGHIKRFYGVASAR